MSVGNQAQAINFANKNLVLVIGENMDLGGDDAGARNGTGKTCMLAALEQELDSLSTPDSPLDHVSCFFLLFCLR